MNCRSALNQADREEVTLIECAAVGSDRVDSGESGLEGDDAKKASILGALSLYLDFINLFLFMLRIFGSSR